MSSRNRRTSCRAETRSQGIATRPPAPRSAGVPGSALQSRDPFSGDCNEKEKQRGLVAPIPVSGRLQRDA
jgi:hypothetical protein